MSADVRILVEDVNQTYRMRRDPKTNERPTGHNQSTEIRALRIMHHA